MKERFELQILDATCFVGIQILRTKDEIIIHQKKYIEGLVKELEMESANAVETPGQVSLVLISAGANDNKHIVGSALHLHCLFLYHFSFGKFY